MIRSSPLPDSAFLDDPIGWNSIEPDPLPRSSTGQSLPEGKVRHPIFKGVREDLS
jgi:hypothetical protein